MQLSFVLSKYIARRYFMSVMLVLVIMVAVTFLVDIVNLGGRAASRDSADLALVLEMALLRIPYFMVKILPFAVLFGTMLTYLWLTRTHELVVMRASGVSVWQFLLPALAITVVLGVATITIFNPLASALISRFEQLENRNVRSQANVLAVAPGNMWIREGDDTRQSVIHAHEVSASGTELEDVIILVFGESDRFIERYDAKRATLGDHRWDMEEVLISRPDQSTTSVSTLEVPTELSLDRLQAAFASPETISFWDLPGFITVMENAGFSALQHRIHWHAVLAIPLFLASMVLVAATFSLRLTRQGNVGLFAVAGLGFGFVVYVVSDIFIAYGMSGNLPVLLAVWGPVAIFTAIGSTMLLHTEDG